MSKPRLATCTLAGCFGCHMSLLDIDERIVELVELVDLDVTPLTDKKRFDRPVDIGFIEGGASTEHNVEIARAFREHCRILVAVGACAVNGGVPAMRNPIGLQACLETAYLGDAQGDEDRAIPRDEDLPRLLDRVYPIHRVVRVDYFLPGCPPSADAIWDGLTDLCAGRPPRQPYRPVRYD